ncbi:MAG: hypothetical protein ABSH52_12860 [Terriglobia bacterium]|jgi:hypothetical protein
MRTGSLVQRNFIGFAACIAMAAYQLVLGAQAPEEPTAYTVSVQHLSGNGAVVTAYRLGPQVLVDYTGDPSNSNPGTHKRILLNLETKHRLTWDRVDASVPCVRSNFNPEERHGDDLQDLFIGGAALASEKAKQLGTETIHGITTRILETTDDPNLAIRTWVDPRTGLVLRASFVSPATGLGRPWFEVTQVSFEPPPASLFAVPSQCEVFRVVPQTAAAPEGGLAPSGSMGEYAWDGLVGPASKEQCTMLFRVVGSGSLKPLTRGFQVAADLAVATGPSPHYSVRLDDQGRATFSGGQLHELAPEGASGLYRIDNVPDEFVIDVEFGRNGSAAAKIYRHCFGPRTLLEYVAVPEAIHMGGGWEWVKPGRDPNDSH